MIVYSVVDLIIVYDIGDEKYDPKGGWLRVESSFNKCLWGGIRKLGH